MKGMIHLISQAPKCKGGQISLFSDTFDTKFRAENFTHTNTNPYSYMLACIRHQMSYLPLGV